MSTTDAPSQACANSSADHLTWALRAEQRALDFYLQQHYRLLYHRKKIFGVEVDLIFLDPGGAVSLIEVKTLSHRGLMNYRLTAKQSERLFTAKRFFESVYGFAVEVRLAFVDAKVGEVTDFVIL